MRRLSFELPAKAARRELGFEVSDRIRLGVFGEALVREAVERHREYIAGETLAVALVSGAEAPAGGHAVDLDGVKAVITVERA
jgi:isoleucyl-tRNA synthetase